MSKENLRFVQIGDISADFNPNEKCNGFPERAIID